MKHVSQVLAASVAVAFAVCALSPAAQMLQADQSAWSWRRQAINASGVLALLLMTASVWLAQRPAWLDRRLGLDQVYLLHRHVGTAAGIAALLHWLIRQVPRWLVQAGLVPYPGDLSRGNPKGVLVLLYRVGMVMAEYAFYAVAALVAIALLRRVPYGVFRASHRWLPLALLPLAFHATTAPLRDHWYATPAGWLTLAIALACALPALRALTRRIGATRRLQATVAALAQHGESLCVGLSLAQPLPHQAGQFVLLRFGRDAERHPFTIAGVSDDGRTLNFKIKALGDCTRQLPQRLRRGDTVEIEGPYGRFDFHDTAARQVWVAGGIGITPFLRRLEVLARAGQHGGITATPIDLWYCTRTHDEQHVHDELEALCERAGVRLHRWVEASDGHLNASHVHDSLGDLAGAGVWFCGPEPFGLALRDALRSLRFDVGGAFHQERFRFR